MNERKIYNLIQAIEEYRHALSDIQNEMNETQRENFQRVHVAQLYLFFQLMNFLRLCTEKSDDDENH
jgi:hypothetical protein